jgi:hypothetical protein
MSKPPEPQLPAHLRPLTLDIPVTWTAEEALAVFELIDDLRDKICAVYNGQPQALLQQQWLAVWLSVETRQQLGLARVLARPSTSV